MDNKASSDPHSPSAAFPDEYESGTRMNRKQGRQPPLMVWIAVVLSALSLCASPPVPAQDKEPAPSEPSRFPAVMDLLAGTAQTWPAAQKGSDASARLADKIRRACELAQDGDRIKAAEVIKGALRECEAADANVPECAAWSKSLRGLYAMLGKSSEKVVFTNSIGMKLVRLPAGEYMMGSTKQEMDWLRLTFKKTWREGHKQWFQDELPLHPVRMTHSIFMGAHEITVGQFRQFVNETKHKTEAEKGDGGMIWSNKDLRWAPKKDMKWDSLPWPIADNQPVIFVSWNDAQAFCKWLSRKERRTYRLPSEAEWEMACRGGSAWVRFPWGNRLPGEHELNFGDGNPKLPESMTTFSDGHKYVAPVGSYPPNGFGLYDMDGNVMEWVQDYYDRNYFENSPLEDPRGPKVGTSRVNKGGNFFASPADCRCAFRGFSGPEMSFWNLGFRVVLEDDEEDKTTVAGRTGESSGRSAKSSAAVFPPTEADGMRLFRQAVFAAQQQQWEDAISNLEEALKVYEQRDEPMWVARVKATLAGIYTERNRLYKGKELYTQALAEFRKIGDTASARLLLGRLQELETSPGVRVAQVQKGGIADRSGIVKGDIIIEYGGETGFRVAGFKKVVEDYSRSDKVTVSVMNENEITTSVVSGGQLGVAVEDIKRPPRPRQQPEQIRGRPQQDRGRPTQRRRAPARATGARR